MNRKVSLWWFLAYTIIVIGAIAYYDHLKDVDFENKINAKEAERKELQRERQKYFDSIEVLNKELKQIYLTIDTLETKIETIKTRRNEIPSIVDDMPVVKVDSILSGYVHPR